MSITLNKLITEAFYLSTIRSRGYMTVGGDDISLGLDLLNDILSETSINDRVIPYYEEREFLAVIGQEKYEIEGLVVPVSLTFNLNTVRFSTYNVGREKYFGSTRIDKVSSLPFACHFERKKGGCDLYLYFLPSAEYPLKIWGKFALKSDYVEDDLETDLLDSYDRNYLKYLKNLLAQEICINNNEPVSTGVQETINKIAANLNATNPLDLGENKFNCYGNGYYDPFTVANWSRGFSVIGN